MVSLLTIIGPTSKVVVVVVLVMVVVVVVLVTVAAEAVVEAGGDKARINFEFFFDEHREHVHNLCDRFEKERMRVSQWRERERERIVSLDTQYYLIIYFISQSVVTNETEQFLSLRHNNITHHHQNKGDILLLYFVQWQSHTRSAYYYHLYYILFIINYIPKSK